MRILHIGYNDNSGGASEVMMQLSNILNKSCGYESKVIVLEKTLEFNNTVFEVGNSIVSKEELKKQTAINQNRMPLTNTFFSYTSTYRNEVMSYVLENNFDIIHLHWIEKYISLELLKDLYDLKIPIVWTIHDERVYTAGCHCTFGCEEFVTHCKNCIQVKNDKFSTEEEFQRRYAIMKELNIQYIVPSNWIYEQVRKSKILQHKNIDLIHHGIDINRFTLNREEKKLPLQLLFIAANLDAKHKNLEDFLKILNYIDQYLDENIIVNLIGNSTQKQKYKFEKIIVKHIPFISSKEKLIKIYNQSDLFINTTLCESFSLVTVEAMACGCVPITYATGGISDIVDNETAWIFNKGKYMEIAQLLLTLSSDFQEVNQKSVEARKKVVELFSIEKMTDKYKGVYKTLNEKIKSEKDKQANKNLKISIVTVVYNVENDLEETIQSIINQTYFEFVEFIIIDGNSTDGTMDIVNKYKEKIDIIVSEPDDGVYFAMNKAIDLATGNWINFMNAGDKFYDQFVIENFLSQVHPSSDLIYGDVNVIDEGINKIIKADLNNKIFKVTPFCHQSLFVRTALMKQEKFNTTYLVLADYNFILNSYIAHKKFQNLNFVVSKYQLGGMSKQNIHIMHTEGVHILMKAKKRNENIIVEDSNFYKGLSIYIGTKGSLSVYEELRRLSEISVIKYPFKKFKQYKKLLSAYYKN